MNSIAILGLAVAVGAPLPKERLKSMPLVGAWVKIKEVVDGGDSRLPDKPHRYVFDADGTYAIYHGERRFTGGDEYATDRNAVPATIDLKPPALVGGLTKRAIYRIHADTLEVCWPINGGPRPTEFSSHGDSKTVLWVFRRVTTE